MSDHEKEVSFEAAFEQLEQIVMGLERGNLDLSGSLASYERATLIQSWTEFGVWLPGRPQLRRGPLAPVS